MRVHHQSHHCDERLSYDDGRIAGTTDFDYDSIDARNGWAEESDPPTHQQPQPEEPIPTVTGIALTQNPEPVEIDGLSDVDLRGIPLADRAEAMIKLICLFVDSNDIKTTVWAAACGFGLQRLFSGKSFAVLAQECGITRQAFSKKVLRIQAQFGLPIARGQKAVSTRATYSKIQKEIWKTRARQVARDEAYFRQRFDPKKPTPTA